MDIVRNMIKISIHALHEESDFITPPASLECMEFQSTLSMRRATGTRYNTAYSLLFQSTLSMRRATPSSRVILRTSRFQSTLSMRRATVQLDIFVRFLRRKPAA